MEILSNENIRKDLIKYLKKYGVKNKYVADLLNVSSTTICLFLKNKRELSPEKLELIADMIYNR